MTVVFTLPVLLAMASAMTLSGPDTFPLFLYLFLPVTIGQWAGSTLHEVLRRPFSWTLPGLRPKLFRSVLCTGLLASLLWSGFWRWANGPYPFLPLVAAGLFFYSLGVYNGAGQTIKKSFPFVVRAGSGALDLLVILSVFLWANPVGRLYLTRPLLLSFLAVLGASAYLFCVFRFGFNPTPPQTSPYPASYSDRIQRRALYEWWARRNPSRRTWRIPYLDANITRWMRASEYENFAGRRLGRWPGFAPLAFLFAVAAFPFMIFLPLSFAENYRRTHAFGPDLTWLCRILFDPLNVQKHVAMVLMIAMAVCMCFLFFPLSLQKGRLYPLSRPQLARLAYWNSLFYNTMFCFTTALIFLAAGQGVSRFAGIDMPLRDIAWILRPLILILAFAPVFQWHRLRYGHDPYPTIDMPLAGVAYLFLAVLSIGLLEAFLSNAGNVRSILLPGLSTGGEAVLLICLALLSQWLYWRKLRSYFTHGDLI